MNILVFSWRDSKHPLAGGAEQVVFEHMKGWTEAGHKVVHFSSQFEGANANEIVDNVLFVRRGLQLLGVQLAGFFWYIFGNHPKFDLVVDEFHGIPFFTPFFVRKPKLAILQEIAKEVWLQNHLPKPFNWIIGIIGYLFEPFIFLFYKNVPFMVGSNSAKEDLIKMGIKKRLIIIIPHGVLIKYPKPMSPKEKIKTICFLGALAKDKGIEDAIRSFGVLNKKGDFNFWIIGKGGKEYVDSLLEMCKVLGVENKVKFWGGRDKVNDLKKFELLKRAHIMINPSTREGWGLVNIEANAMGTPVVAYNSPGLVDSVKNGVTGIICKYNSPDEMAKEVEFLLDNEKKYKSIQNGALRWADSFSWKVSVRRSLMLIDNILADRVISV